MKELYFKVEYRRLVITDKGLFEEIREKVVTEPMLKEMRQQESISAMKRILKSVSISEDEFLNVFRKGHQNRLVKRTRGS